MNNKQTNKHIFRACVQKFLFEIHSSAKGMSFHFPFSLNALVKTIFLNFENLSPWAMLKRYMYIQTEFRMLFLLFKH